MTGKLLRNAAILLLALSAQALAQSLDFDKGYLTTFGWGTSVVSQDRYPAKDKYEPELFHYKNGVFMITAGENVDLHCRHLLKDGKTYGQYLNALKKSTQKKVATRKDDYLRTLIYVSHDESSRQLYTKWPSSINELPQWKELAVHESNVGDATNWFTTRFSMKENRADMTSLISWLKKARPGWRIYILHMAGYTREAPELKYWDKAELKWMIPLEYVDSEPLSVATIEVEKSTNPLLVWSYKIDKMPSEQKGVKDGLISLYKDGQKVTTFKFGIEYKYQNEVTKLHNMNIHYEYESGEAVGGFPAYDVPSVDKGIDNSFYEAVERALFEEKLK
jgi:hypothetical protein